MQIDYEAFPEPGLLAEHRQEIVAFEAVFPIIVGRAVDDTLVELGRLHIEDDPMPREPRAGAAPADCSAATAGADKPLLKRARKIQTNFAFCRIMGFPITKSA